MSKRETRLAENKRNRERALEIKRCLEIIAPTTPLDGDPDLPENYQIHRDDIEPLAAAIREGRLDLIELALSARHCSAPPETDDTRIIQSDAPEDEKEAARERREKFEREFRQSKKMRSKAAEWAAFLFVNGWCAEFCKNPDEWSKGDIIRFIDESALDLYSAIPTDKKGAAAFWASVGEEIKQAHGVEPKSVEQGLKTLRAAIESLRAEAQA